MRMVEEAEGGLADMMGGGRVRYVMYLVWPQWQDPVYGRRAGEMVVAERDEERDSTASVAILSNIGSEPSE